MTEVIYTVRSRLIRSRLDRSVVASMPISDIYRHPWAIIAYESRIHAGSWGRGVMVGVNLDMEN